MARISRPRHRAHRRRSRRLAAFLTAMSTKYDTNQTPIAVNTVGSDVLAMASTPPTSGPFAIVGAIPPELRDPTTGEKFSRIWIDVDGSDNATVYTSLRDLSAGRGALTIDSWDLSPDVTSLTATAAQINTLDAGTTVDTLTSFGTVDTLGATVEITGSTFADNTLTIVGHGYVPDQGPFYLTGADLPDGLTAATPYWIKTVPTADTFTLAATLGGAVIDTLDDGSGAMSIRPVNVDISLDTLEIAAHGLTTGDGPFRLTTDGALPAGSATGTNYWAIALTADRFKLATTRANAIDGAAVDLTDVGSGTQTVWSCNVDTTTEKFHKAAHGLTTGQLVRLTTDGALPTGVAVTTNYWVIRNDADFFQLAASLADSGTGTAISLTDIGSGTTTVSLCNIDTTLDTYHAVAHGFASGDGPVRATTGTTLPTGITADTDYYVIRVDADNFKLSDTEAHALAGTNVVDITAIGAGTQTITLAGVDVTEEHLRSAAHGMETGDGPVRFTTNGALPTGISAGVDYWIIKLSADTFAVATSYANAVADTPTKVNLTDVGSGTHQVVRALSLKVDLSADGILEWLAQGVSKQGMNDGSAGNADTIFV